MDRFSNVSDEIRERREKGCLACPHLIYLEGTSPEKTRIGKGICVKTGVSAAVKVRLSIEKCPVAHPQKEGYTRWDEPDHLQFLDK